MRTIECHCDQTFEAEIQDSYDLDKQPELLEEIVSGRFLTFTCPHCKAIIKPELPFELIQPSKKIYIQFVPELDRSKFRDGEITVTAKPDAERTRLVIGYHELVEKLNIFELALDDRALEVLKFHILTKAMEQEEDDDEPEETDEQAVDETEETKAGKSRDSEQEPEEEAIYVFFKEQAANQLVFHIHNLKPGNVAIFKLSSDVYEKLKKNIEQTLKKDPFNRILKPPYVSINNLYMEK